MSDFIDAFDPQEEYPVGIVSEGKHLCSITACTKIPSKKGPFENLVFRFEVIGEDEFEGQDFVRYVPIKKGFGANLLASICRAVNPGIKSIKFDAKGLDLRNQESIHEHLLLKPVCIDVVHEDNEYQGKTTKKPNIGTITHPTKAQLATLIEKYNEGGNEATPRPPDDCLYYPKDKPETEEGNTDSIPF